MPNTILNIPGSKAPDVRVWLYEQFNAYMTDDPLNPDATLGIFYDDPPPGQPDDVVIIGEVNRQLEFSSFVGDGGAGWLAERFTIAVTIDVYRGGDDAPAVNARGQLLADTVIAICRNDLTAGGNVLTATPHGDTGHGSWDENHMGRHWTVDIEISCYARL
jgi:hypothetical protein